MKESDVNASLIGKKRNVANNIQLELVPVTVRTPKSAIKVEAFTIVE